MSIFCEVSLRLFADAGDAAEITAFETADQAESAGEEEEKHAAEKTNAGGKDAQNGGETNAAKSVGDSRAVGDADNVLNGVREAFGENLKNAETEAVLASWRREEQATREIYPSFSMKNELLNEPMFGTLLKSGVGVRRAYECVHLEEIIGSAIRYAVADIGRKTALNPSRAQSRPGENSVLGRAASVTRTDVNSLTDRDIKRILSEVSRGAKISFK